MQKEKRLKQQNKVCAVEEGENANVLGCLCSVDMQSQPQGMGTLRALGSDFKVLSGLIFSL